MTYEEALEYIYSRRKFQKSNGLERMERLLELLGNPQKSLLFIHVAGTNGKGSVSTALSNILLEGGYTVGLFTSPFVTEFGERIRVNGIYMPREAIARGVELIKEKLDIMEDEELFPTVFEVTTALGMVHFYESSCDYVVLEAGIGGCHDSTNVIPSPEICLFTHISIDHADMLGNTPEEIAREKSGIIKGGATVISYPEKSGDCGFIPQRQEVAAVLKAKAEEEGCEFISPDAREVKSISSDIRGSEFFCYGMELKTRLPGEHQIGNMLTAVSAARELIKRGAVLSEKSIRDGIAKTLMPARTEVLSESPLIILDGGHNEGCMKALSAVIDKYLKGKNIIMLMALMKDKDIESVLEQIAPKCSEMVMANVDPVRGAATEYLKKEAEEYCNRVSCCDDPCEAFEKIRDRLGERDVLIAAGSFYLAGEIRNKFFS